MAEPTPATSTDNTKWVTPGANTQPACQSGKSVVYRGSFMEMNWIWQALWEIQPSRASVHFWFLVAFTNVNIYLCGSRFHLNETTLGTITSTFLVSVALAPFGGVVPAEIV